MIIALTGHREQRLNLPSDVALDDWKNIRQWIRQQIIDNKADTVLSGMADGSDLAIAYEVVQMKKEGYPIKLTCVFPCKNCGYQICKPFMDAPTCDNCGEEVALSFFDLIETVVTENPQGTLTDYLIRNMYLKDEE